MRQIGMSAQSSPSKKRSRRVWPWIVLGLLVVANLVVFGAYFFARSLETGFVEAADVDTEVAQELNAPASSGDPVTFLVIGSDSRAGLDDLENFGDFAGERADAMMLVQVIPGEQRAQVLSLPRDLKVQIDGHGTNRLNAAYAFGGPTLLVKTIKEETGLPIHHFVAVDLVGFQSIVDEVGGVTLTFPYRARDTKSGFTVEAGTQRLDGEMALAFARSRHYQEYREGEWRSVRASDIGRTERQQQLIFAVLLQLRSPGSIFDAGSIVKSFAQHLTIDSTLAERSLIALALAMRNLQPGNIETLTMPTVQAPEGGRSYLGRLEPEATQVIDAFANRWSLVVAADGPMEVQVLNGNGESGAAGTMEARLEALGFDVAAVGNAARDDYTVTLVLVEPDRIKFGQAIIDALGFGTLSQASVGGAFDAVVIVGLDSAA